MLYNPELMKLALWSIQQKRAFVPPGAGGDPSAGGMPPGGPGGAPPGMDPSGGGAPPMDPSMAGGAPPPPGGGGDPSAGGTPDIAGMIQQAVSQAMQQFQMQGGGGAGGAAGAGGMGKPMKASLETVGMDIFQVKKMLTALFNMNNWPLPPDVLDGPNRDPSTGMPMAPGAPGSTSDASMQQQQPQGQQQQSAIPSIQPMQGASPQSADPTKSAFRYQIGEEYDKQAQDQVYNRAAALGHLMTALRKARCS